MTRLTFVIPRYGSEITGGAEVLTAQIARQAALRGHDVAVATTCAVDHRTWENALPAGTTEENGIKVHRFPVNPRDLSTWVPLQVRLSQGFPLTLDEQLDWLGASVNSNGLYSFLLESYPHTDLFIFAPYLFGTSFWGAQLVKDKAVLLPCLHDEPYARLEVMWSLFRSVRGCIFNAYPEELLAKELYGPLAGGVVGMGFDNITTPRETSRLDRTGDKPYLLYLGRKETGKNAHLLIDWFLAAKEAFPELAPLQLAFAGPGEFSDLLRPAALERKDIIDLGLVSESEKTSLLQHSLALVQLSMNESFSIVMMEAWLQGTPVLVHGNAAVPRYHAEKSGGGLPVYNLLDFAGATRELLARQNLRGALGKRGFEYVRKQFNWTSVMNRFDLIIHALLHPEAQHQLIT